MDRPSGPAAAALPRLVLVNRFFHPDLSATSQMAAGLAFALAERGHQVHVVTSRLRHDDPAAVLPRAGLVEGVVVHRLGGSAFGRTGLAGRAMDYLTFHIGALVKVLRLVRAGDAVVACTDPPLLSIPLAVACRLRRAALLTWLHDIFPEVASELGVGGRRSLLLGALRVLRDLSLRAARTNVVLGERMAERVRACGVRPGGIAVVHNFADPDAIRPIARDANPLRKAWALDGRFVVGYCGNLGRAHEFATILDAAEALRDREDVVFLFVGDGHRRREVEAEVARRGLANVLFRPLQPAERLGALLALPDVHLVSLRPELEGLIVPSKVYGIMAAGRPTVFVGAQDGEVARVLARHGCGWTVPIGNGEALAERLGALHRDPACRAAMGVAARTALLEHYARGHAVDAWDAVVRRALRAPAPRVDAAPAPEAG